MKCNYEYLYLQSGKDVGFPERSHKPFDASSILVSATTQGASKPNRESIGNQSEQARTEYTFGFFISQTFTIFNLGFEIGYKITCTPPAID